MSVGHKVWELFDPVLNSWVLCVEDVDSILWDADPVFVDVVVAVPADVGPLVDHQRGETQAGTGLLWDLKFKRNLKKNIAKGTTDPGVDCFNK